MSRMQMGLRSLCALAMLVGAVCIWPSIAAEDAAEAPQKHGLASPDLLGGTDRYLTHLSTDKPLYRPGEQLRVRGVMLHAESNRPRAAANLAGLVTILGPKGEAVANGFAASQDSVLAFAWDIPDQQAGGEYTLQLFPFDGQAPAERKFQIRAFRAPRLKSQLKFIRDGYGPGDQVAAMLHVERAEGGVPENAVVTVTARVDGKEVFKGKTSVDENGNCRTQFALPEEIQRGQGSLSMAIADGGVVETASKTIPILLRTVDLHLFPEGGDLVAGLKTRVYFEAFTPAGKPADLAGVVVDQNDKKVAEFRSEHEGRGRFSLKPKAGEKYKLKVTEPAGISGEYDLPGVLSEGAVISARRDVYPSRNAVTLRVASTQPSVTVTLSKRGKLLGIEKVEGSGRVRFDPPQEVSGVLVATVWDQAGKPLAERLVFRQPKRAVRLELAADADRYSPGGKVRVSVRTSDEQGRPVSAVVGVTVTDDSVLELIEKREQIATLPTMVFLESEVRELADAHVYLDSANDASPIALDLLLGTQGWRRFAFADPAAFTKQHQNAARRVLASVQPVPQASAELFRGFRNEARNDQWMRWRGAVPRFAAGGEKAVRDHLEVDRAAPKLKAPEGAAAVEAPAEDKPADAPQAEKEEAAGIHLVERLPARGNARQLRKLDAADGEALFMRRRGGGRGFGGGFGLALGGRVHSDLVAVRVFAHQVRPDRKPNDRVDFTETLFWHAGLKTDVNGEGSFEFGLSDAVTSFRVTADAFSADGGLGGQTLQIESVKPFYLEPKLPLEVTQGDRIHAPLGIVNATRETLDNGAVTVAAKGYETNPSLESFEVTSEQRRRALLQILAGEHGEHEVVVSGQAGGNLDKVTRKLIVKPRGFPVEYGRGGLLASNGSVEHQFTLPKDIVPGSLRGRIVIYPTPLANMTESLQRLIREPNGCFEQTSSTTYPLVMAQQYFMSHQGVDPSLIERSATVLEKGYNRLIGFESPSGGFEWFGRDPGHDALTAYGILEFTDMSQVRFVDEAMLDRTRAWLLKQRDGKGGFVRRASTLHTWVADPEISNTYILWALLEAGEKSDLSTEIAWVRDAGEKTQNTYVMALAANVLGLADDDEGQNHLLDALSGKQREDGSLEGAVRSVVGSSGSALEIETTALAVMAWLKNPSYSANVEQSIKFLAEHCKAGRFGSTQSTVLALRAIVAYDQSRATPKSPGEATLVVNGEQVGDAIAFSADEQGVIELPQVENLKPGEHKISLAMKDGSRMPYSIAFDYYREQPDSSAQCDLHLEVNLSDERLKEGTSTEAKVTVVNRSDEKVASPIAIVGVPGGLEVRHDQLKELVKADKIAAYEVKGREVILYWRTLDAEQRVDLPLDLVAEIPGRYTAPASRAYLYYTDEHKQWTPPLAVTIEAK